MDTFLRIAPVPASVVLVAFLFFGSQALFSHIDPGPLDTNQTVVFDVLVGCLYICYARACVLDPGRVPDGWAPSVLKDESGQLREQRSRWCKRCERLKPMRAHHCKTCKRCIPKMDHHCPWTMNCVSHRTLPSFMRFVFYATASAAYLEYFLYVRGSIIWENRKLPSYLGPTATQLLLLFALILVNSLCLFAITVIFVTSVKSLCENTTTIEGWEVQRHEVLLRRAKYLGGYLDGPEGTRVRITRQEFPYDIGIWTNIVQGMNGGPLTWFWPFASSPRIDGGLEFEVNGFEDASVTWPPPDPDRIAVRAGCFPSDPFVHASRQENDRDRIEAFRQRQQEDLGRHRVEPAAQRRRPFHERYGNPDSVPDSGSQGDDFEAGEEAWRNSEGERLRDFGVDEDAEFYDEDDVPLAQLMKQRRMKAQ